MPSPVDNLTGSDATKAVAPVEKIFKGAPQLPKGLIDFFVSLAPWLALIGGIISIYGGLTSLIFSSRNQASSAFLKTFAGINPAYFTIAAIFGLVSGALLLMAFKPLKAQKMSGWMLLFWVEVLTIAESVISIFFGAGGLLGSLIGAILGLYVLFQMKPAYKK